MISNEKREKEIETKKVFVTVKNVMQIYMRTFLEVPLPAKKNWTKDDYFCLCSAINERHNFQTYTYRFF